MKKIALFLACIVAVAMMASCGSSSNVASSDAAAVASGAACGKALTGLYTSYNATGTISLTNANDLSNALTVATAYTQLKNNKSNEAYKKSFCSGMVSAGMGLITTANATTIMNKMLALTGLSNVNAQNIAQKAETVSALITLLNALKS